MRGDPAQRIRERAHRELEALESFRTYEQETATTILQWCRIRHVDLDDEEYRSVAFIKNEEYACRRGALTLLYTTWKRLERELGPSTRENAIDRTRYRYRVYFAVLRKGGFV